MSTSTVGADIPKTLEDLRERVAAWRGTNSALGMPIPAELWEAAGRLAVTFGVGKVARMTGLDYVWLGLWAAKAAKHRSPSAPAFLEIPAGLLVSPALDHPGGGR
jgi:hypothetical protein